jgi:tetratricopeptide (TPR) repeat protein
MNRVPAPQKYLIYLTWVFAGFMGLGGVISVLSDAFDFITRPIAIGGTVLIILFWFAAQQYLKRYPYRLKKGRITRLNFGMALPLLGMIVLLWLPILTQLMPEERPFPRERDGETLIVIATFERTEGVTDVNAHGEIQRAIEDKLAELNVENIRVEIEPRAIASRDRAKAEEVGRGHNASIIIWGADSGVRLEVNFLDLKEPDPRASQITISETEYTQLARPDAYNQFVVNDLPLRTSFLALFAIGRSFYLQEQFTRAIDLIQEAINLADNFDHLPPEFALDAAHLCLGYLYQTTNQLEQTIIHYNQVIAANPQAKAAFHNRGNAYRNLGEYDKAIADYSWAIALDPQSSLAFNSRGIAYSNLGEHQKAIADYIQAIALDPHFSFAFNNRGISYADLGEYDRVIADYDQAIALDPQYALAFTNRGIVYVSLGEYERAIVDHNQAIALNPQLTNAFLNRGLAYNKLSEYEKAITDFNQAIALGPQDAMVFHSRGTTYTLLGEYDKAISDFDQAIALDPQYAAPYYIRALIYRTLGQDTRELSDLRSFLTLSPDSPQGAEVETRIAELETLLGE